MYTHTHTHTHSYEIFNPILFLYSEIDGFGLLALTGC